MYCIFCNKKCGNNGGLVNHIKSCKLNPDYVKRVTSPLAGYKKDHKPWNKGLVGDIRNKCSDDKKNYLKKICKGISKTPELEILRKEKISNTMKNNKNSGGYRKGSGRGKSGWYKGFYCDSSYELVFVIFCLENGINIKRNTEKRKYLFNNKEKNYIPDFIIDNELVEIKGYKSPEWFAKLEYNKDIKVYYKEDLKEIFNYVINKYGKNFISLYE